MHHHAFHDVSSAQRAVGVPSSDILNHAFSVEVVLIATMQYSDLVTLFVVHQTNLALGMLCVLLWVVTDFAEHLDEPILPVGVLSIALVRPLLHYDCDQNARKDASED